jgi:peptidoglycan/xylan/chitin deacetylase (PgdA/CDA1 family)
MLKPTLRYLRNLAQLPRHRLPTPQQRLLTILCLHRVLPPLAKERYYDPGLALTPDAFTTLCAFLKRHYEVLPLAEALPAWEESNPRSRPLAVITFDDGYRDNYIHARSILDTFGLRATFFAIAGLADTAVTPWYDRLGRAVLRLDRASLKRLPLPPPAGRDPAARARALVEQAKRLAPSERMALVEQLELAAGTQHPADDRDLPMSAEQLRELADAGHEVAAHSMTHPILTQCDDMELAAETRGAREHLEALIQRPVPSFCYPNGSYDGRVIAAVQAAGFESAVTTRCGLNALPAPRYELARVYLDEDRLSRPWGGISNSALRRELAPLRYNNTPAGEPT